MNTPSVIRVVAAAAVLPGVVFAQRVDVLPTAPIKPVTVCEVLANLKKFSGKPVAIVGRLDCTYNVIDTHCYLVEGRCNHPFLSHGEAWPNKIWLEWEHLDSDTPRTSAAVDEVALREKLAVVRRSTSLGSHRVMQMKLIDGVIKPIGWANEPDTWGVGYGHIIKGRPVNFFGAPVGMTIRTHDLRDLKREEYPEPDGK